MQGIPHYDIHLTAIENGKTAAEVGTALGAASRDPKVTAMQLENLQGLARFKIRALTGNEHHSKDGLTTVTGSEPQPLPNPSKSASPTEEPAPGGTPTPAAIIAAAPLMPTTSAPAMREAITAWDKLAKAIERPEDLCTIDGRPYRKVTFWRKVGMAYSIEVRQLSKSSNSADETHGGTPSAEVNLRLTSPTGRFVDAVGMCHGREGRFRKKDGSCMEASEHTITSLAWTRAYCRGMRVLIGFGEPSAEEVEE